MEYLTKFAVPFIPRRILFGADIAEMHLPAANLSALRETDAFIVSYPRSGNRWIRAMLCAILAADAASRRGPVASESVPQMPIADLHQVSLEEMMTLGKQFDVRIFKSHNIRALTGRKMVYLYRNAADALVSYFHFRLQQPQWRTKTAAVGLDRFCRSMLSGWCNHLQIALDEHARNPARVRFVSFELLKRDAETALSEVAQFFGLTANIAVVKEAVEENTFERNAKQIERGGPPGSSPILRKGRVGSAAEELRNETLAEIEHVSRDYYAKADAIAAAPLG